MCNIIGCISLKAKGYLISALLVSTAIATSVLTFTTNCSQVLQVSGNSTQTINNIGSANRAVSISLLVFSVVSSIFEHHVNKKLLDSVDEIEELKTQLAHSRQNNDTDRNSVIINEPIQSAETRRSDDTVYPAPVSFQQYSEERR